MEKKSNVGRKVRITENYRNARAEYIGQTGIVKKEGSNIWVITMPDGNELHPYAPDRPYPQCELLPEENYNITANQPTDMTTTEKIEALEKQLQELKESLNWKPKVGDWVVTTKRELNYTNDGAVGNIGTIYQVQEILEDKAGAWYRRTKGNTDGAKASSLRKATPEEIEEATSKEIKVTIGTEGKEVVISKGKIVAPDGKTVDISNVNQVIEVMRGKIQFSGWGVTFPEVKIGCIESISYDQLKAVQEAYEKLTNN